jgi:hypothetical protein
MAEVVTMKHMRQAKYCRRGVMAFFKRHGFDWSSFLRDGIDANKLKNTGDAMAIKVAEMAANGRKK